MQINDEVLTQIEREAVKDSFFEFFISFWGVISKEDLSINWHIPFLCEELQDLSFYIVNRLEKPYDEIINIPPGTTKSTICTVMWPVWLWTQDQSIKIITNSHSSGLAIEHATKSRDLIESDKFKRLFPEIVLRPDKSAKGFYENTGGGSRYSTSTGSSAIGMHAHVILHDDPSDPKQVFSEAMRAQVEEKIKELSTRKVNKLNTITVTIMQRLHEQDATGYMLSVDKTINHFCLPAELSESVKPAKLKEFYINGLLDPVRQSQQVLDDAKRELGSARYAGQYEQKPTVPGGNIVKESWFPKIDYATFQAISKGHAKHFFADTAFTEKKENDPTGIIGTCNIGNLLYVFAATKVRMKFPDLCRFLPSFVLQNGYNRTSTVRIEPKANGLSVIDQLREVTGLNVVGVSSPLLKDSKRTRLETTSPTIEAQRVILVQGDWNESFTDEICGFPGKTHDEYVDLICYAVDFHLSGNNDIADEVAERAARML